MPLNSRPSVLYFSFKSTPLAGRNESSPFVTQEMAVVRT